MVIALLAVFGQAAFWPSKTRAGTGKVGSRGRVATRIVHRPVVPLTIGVPYRLGATGR